MVEQNGSTRYVSRVNKTRELSARAKWDGRNSGDASEIHGLLDTLCRRVEEDPSVPADVIDTIFVARRLADELTDRLFEGPESMAN